MNTVLPAVRQNAQQHSPPAAAQPQTVQPQTAQPRTVQPRTVQPRAVQRVSLPDRVAMRLGLALLTWSRRRGSVDARTAARAHFERDRAQQLRDRAAERANRLLAVLR